MRSFPHDFLYTSKRLTHEIVDEYEAAKQRLPWTWALQIQLYVLSLTMSRRAPNDENRFFMALRATDATKHETGTLGNPGIYVRDDANLRCCVFRVHSGWQPAMNKPVAAFVADEIRADTGRTFVVLVGSVSNYIGHKREKTGVGGWFPSEIRGLYGILDSTLEDSDESLDSHYLTEDSELDDARLEVAYDLFGRNPDKSSPVKHLDFFARVHYRETDCTFRKEHYDTVLLGAPIWVAAPLQRKHR